VCLQRDEQHPGHRGAAGATAAAGASAATIEAEADKPGQFLASPSTLHILAASRLREPFAHLAFDVLQRSLTPAAGCPSSHNRQRSASSGPASQVGPQICLKCGTPQAAANTATPSSTSSDGQVILFVLQFSGQKQGEAAAAKDPAAARLLHISQGHVRSADAAGAAQFRLLSVCQALRTHYSNRKGYPG